MVFGLDVAARFWDQLGASPMTPKVEVRAFESLGKWRVKVRLWENGSVQFLYLEDDTGTVYDHLS